MSAAVFHVPWLRNIQAVASGGDHFLALSEEGEVFAWGDNTFNQTDIPIAVSTGQVKAIAAGPSNSAAVLSNGTVAVWGSNQNSQLDVPEGLDNVATLAVGEATVLALREDGYTCFWGAHAGPGSWGTMDSPGFKVVSVGAGGLGLVAVFDDGELGVLEPDLDPSYEQIPPKLPLPPIQSVAVGSGFVILLTRDGRITGWGRNDFFQLTPPPNLRNVKSISAGDGVALALLEDGSVVGWGSHTPPAGLKDAVAIAAGTSSLALLRNGRVVQW